MGMILYVKRKLNALHPADSVALEGIHSLENDVEYKVKITRPRNVGHHRKYFAFLGLVFDNLPEEMSTLFPSKENLLTELKLQAGWYDTHYTLGGKEIITPKSISFSSMAQNEFEEFYEKSIDIVCRYILPGMTSEDIQSQLLEF